MEIKDLPQDVKLKINDKFNVLQDELFCFAVSCYNISKSKDVNDLRILTMTALANIQRCKNRISDIVEILEEYKDK